MTPTTERTVPIKNNEETGFAGKARAAIKAAMDEMDLQVGGLFVLLYEREPVGSEVQTLRNRLNRGNPGADFLGLCVSKMPPLKQRQMAEFFGLTEPEQKPS